MVARAFLDKGYNTNYAAGWHLVRSAPKFSQTGGVMQSMGTAGNEGMKGTSTTQGPLKLRILETGPVVSSNVALLGDAAPGDITEGILSLSIKYDSTDAFANGSTDAKTFLEQGELLSEAFNDGPAFWDAGSSSINLVTHPADLSIQAQCETAGSCPAPTDSTSTYLQDTRDWYAVHGGGKNGSCNILMADASVKEFTDGNNDKFLNPGFPVDPSLTPADYAGIGYRDSTVELAPGQIFNGVFLINLQKNADFE